MEYYCCRLKSFLPAPIADSCLSQVFPPRRWEDLDVAPLCLLVVVVVVPSLAFVVAAVVGLVLVVGFVAAYV